jgi:hypothetical protein
VNHKDLIGKPTVLFLNKMDVFSEK